MTPERELILLLPIPKYIKMQIKTNHVYGSDLDPLNCTPKEREGEAEADLFHYFASSENRSSAPCKKASQ